jgi:hypothetical protein
MMFMVLTRLALLPSPAAPTTAPPRLAGRLSLSTGSSAAAPLHGPIARAARLAVGRVAEVQRPTAYLQRGRCDDLKDDLVLSINIGTGGGVNSGTLLGDILMIDHTIFDHGRQRDGPASSTACKTTDAAAAVLLPGLTLSTGTTAAAPQTTAIANCSVRLSTAINGDRARAHEVTAGTTEWIRIDRLDGLDQSVDNFPVWVKQSWGLGSISFQFSGMKGDNPGNWGPLISFGHIELTASGWSARWNGTRTTAPSAVTRVFYDWRGFRAQRFWIKATPKPGGCVELQGVNLNASLPSAVRWTFNEFLPVARSPNTDWSAPPSFDPNANSCTNCGSLQAYGDSPVTVAFATPGVYYWGVTGATQGMDGHASAGGTGGAGCNGCHPYLTPMALVVPGPGMNASVPAGFLGEVVTLPHIVAYQICITTHDLTIFSSAKLFLPLCRPAPLAS